VNSTTYEEANMAVGNWIRQRSRWIKGYMQTVLVHTRHPVRLVRTVGLRQSLGFALLIGGTPLMFLATPWLYLLFLTDLLFPGAVLPALPEWLTLVSLANLLFGNGVIIYLSLLAGFKRRSYGLVPFALLSPLYWLLHSIASYKAAWQLLTKPFYWEKTQHGLSAHVQGGSAGPAAAPEREQAPVPAGSGRHAATAATRQVPWRDVAGPQDDVPTPEVHP
jgi:cellulose synthase/poly-beta-1,6-N-acetylglucosamine synthase-like glycosyltransferase